MHNSGTLFGHLATRFSSHPENIATEALLYILNNSDRGNDLFARFLADFEDLLPAITRFSSQVSSDDNTIPDMVGMDASGNRVLIVENKFWAELTPNQPLGYLPLLSKNGPGALVFICPQERIHVLNAELERLVNESGQYPDYQNIRKLDDAVSNRVSEHHYLIITSWRRIIADLESLLDPIKERTILNDLQQLNGLCEEMDREGFIPLRDLETGNLDIPRRVLNYLDLIDAICEEAHTQGNLSFEGLRQAATGRWSGRYVWIRKKDEFGARLALDFEAWRKHGRSPIWLSCFYADWGRGKEFEELIKSSDKLYFELGDSVGLPIHLLTNADRRQVVEDCSRQIGLIAQIIFPGAQE